MRRGALTFQLAMLPSLLLAGCAGTDLLPGATTGATDGTAGAPTLALPKISLPDLTTGKDGKPPVGTPTEIYSRVARGALTCWLGAHGHLKKTHVFHAESQPAHKGGHSKIAIDERRKAVGKLRGRRVFTIEITANPVTGDGAVTSRNLKLPKSVAAGMEKDVARWAAAEVGCVDGGVTTGWEAAPAGKKKN